MASLTADQVRLIANQVVSNMRFDKSGSQNNPSVIYEDSSRPNASVGVFSSINSAVKAAQKAQVQLMELSLAQRERIILNIRSWMMDNAEILARKAYEETGLGRFQDKIIKNKLVTEKTPGTEVLRPEAVSGDRGLTLMERAPYGVIGSITPCTNPTSTIICNTIGMLAAGNSVVFNVHPTAKNVSIYNIELLNKAIIQAGGPENLVTTVIEPTIQSAQELMTHPGINLLVVTGGAAVVKAAMTSGKRAICAGPGNPPVVVDETADIEKAAKSIVNGASMDNNIICVLEKEVFVVESVADQLLSAFQRHNAVVLKTYEIEQLDKVIFDEILGSRKPGKINKSYIGKPIQEILQKIGKHVDDSVKLAIAPVEIGHPLVWTEQMLPVMPLVRMPNVDQAIDAARDAEHGFRHTAMMHSKNLDNLSRMARVMNCSIFVKNGSSVAGLGYGGEGYCSFTIASPTGEGLTHPISFTRERRCVLVDHFRII
ncbi:MAG: aldehyde dehydrogenase EutE [Candidatus Marinimicrobia bacterium]|jgi:acyl-CoA reductase-like NAD-dependent aldehyde dehydrogenase|nr:aldehyde dehydrogenase EutE [Candidatus Neomarinimicrobiota bacterium]MBT3634553.1 aldehyde dehydrogenase EutE [Candidatus Neomarinimicrobiota bacterium]MBT3683366.1 aldehyde dehydrogenase EutE [Candidatus Neomarinimicrobiota bacterium]MBT3760207.1 aldehyde dehydrogenase EutE [Candidatus Neomarinimicrobiota bacterium]MBT3896302.1 aldehyde dehydrogenase EutE [Candidatus Neomarinimicrobiota bacterium]